MIGRNVRVALFEGWRESKGLKRRRFSGRDMSQANGIAIEEYGRGSLCTRKKSPARELGSALVG